MYGSEHICGEAMALPGGPFVDCSAHASSPWHRISETVQAQRRLEAQVRDLGPKLWVSNNPERCVPANEPRSTLWGPIIKSVGTVDSG